jgi:hypothetical protein
MKRFLAIVLLGLSSFVSAQTVETTPNLITSGSGHSWYGVTTGTIPSGCGSNNDGGACSGGPQPLYDPTTNTISFSYNTSASVVSYHASGSCFQNPSFKPFWVSLQGAALSSNPAMFPPSLISVDRRGSPVG